MALNTRLFERILASHDLDTDGQAAAVMGVHRTAVLRVRTGKVDPSTRFMAATRLAFPEVATDDLYTPVDFTPRRKRRT